MHSSKYGPIVILLTMISLLLLACSAATSLPQPTRALSASPTPTSSPTLTQTSALTRTPTVPPAATWTQLPSPTASPVPTLTPSPAPLSADGPWLVIATDQMGTQASTIYLVMNADGTGLQPLGLPATPEKRSWFFLSEPRGLFLAFRTLPTEGPIISIKADGLDDFVWVVKLPENRVVRKLPLLSEAAWQVIRAAQASRPDDFEYGNLPTQLGLVVNPDSFQWSPHGRYMTYSAALDGQGTDLYLYDTQKDTTRRLTQGRAGAQVWFWSPDGGTLFYTNGSYTCIPYGWPELCDLEGRYAVDLLLGSERRLYQPQSWEMVIYASDQDFLVTDSGFETPPSNLRQVNFKTGAIRTLYRDSFSWVAVSDAVDGQTILLSFNSTIPYHSMLEGISPGIYRMNPASGKPDLIHEGYFWSMDYEPSLHLFYALEEMSPSIFDLILFDHTGQEKLRLPNTNRVIPSPDGQSIVAGTGWSWKVYTLRGDALTGEEEGEIAWLDDSSGFYAHSSCDPDIRFYAKTNDWQPMTVYQGKCSAFYVVQKE